MGKVGSWAERGTACDDVVPRRHKSWLYPGCFSAFPGLAPFLEAPKRSVASLTRRRPVDINNSNKPAYLDDDDLSATINQLTATTAILFGNDHICSFYFLRLFAWKYTHFPPSLHPIRQNKDRLYLKNETYENSLSHWKLPLNSSTLYE